MKGKKIVCKTVLENSVLLLWMETYISKQNTKKNQWCSNSIECTKKITVYAHNTHTHRGFTHGNTRKAKKFKNTKKERRVFKIYKLFYTFSPSVAMMMMIQIGT